MIAEKAKVVISAGLGRGDMREADGERVEGDAERETGEGGEGEEERLSCAAVRSRSMGVGGRTTRMRLRNGRVRGFR